MELIPFPCATDSLGTGLTYYRKVGKFPLYLLSSQQAGMAPPAGAQDLLMPEESEGLWKLGPKKLAP